MKNIFLILAVIAAAPARADRFETQVVEALQPFVAEDAFAEVGPCGVLDIKTIRPFNLDEAADLVKPCMEAVAKKYSAKAVIETGYLTAPQNGQVGKAGILIKTDLAWGSKPHRDVMAALARRQSRLLGHPAKILTKGEAAPVAISALQGALGTCMLPTVVRDIRTGDDFVKIYGSCLTRNPDLKIAEVSGADGLAIAVKAEAPMAYTYNGLLTVDAGKGPVQIIVSAIIE